MKKVVRCKTLLGHENLDFSIECLRSFINKSYDVIHLEIFEDGSITEQDAEKLTALLPNSSVIYRSQREQIIAEKLAWYPNCLYIRNLPIVFPIKLFDTILYDNQDFWYIDSDIFFIRNFKLPEGRDEPIFMKDTWNSYAFSIYDFIKIKYPIYPKINAGVIYFPTKSFDLNFLENVLNDHLIAKNREHFLMEQTLWAFLFGQSKTVNYLDPLQVMMGKKHIKLNHETIAVHLVYSYRDQLKNIKKFRIEDADENRYEPIRLLKAPVHLSKISYAVNRVSKKIYWYLSRMEIIDKLVYK